MTPEKRAGQSAAGELGSSLDVFQLEVDKNGALVSLEPGSWFVCFVPGLQKQWWHPFVHKMHKHVFALRPPSGANGPSVVKRLLYPLALWRYRSPLQDPSCDHYACGCVWCEHGVVGHDQRAGG